MKNNHYVPVIGARLNEAIAKRDTTITDVAKGTGISRSNIYSYAFYGVMPSAYQIIKICSFLNITSDWLLGLER